jgi:hypothetical protein
VLLRHDIGAWALLTIVPFYGAVLIPRAIDTSRLGMTEHVTSHSGSARESPNSEATRAAVDGCAAFDARPSTVQDATSRVLDCTAFSPILARPFSQVARPRTVTTSSPPASPAMPHAVSVALARLGTALAGACVSQEPVTRRRTGTS